MLAFYNFPLEICKNERVELTIDSNCALGIPNAVFRNAFISSHVGFLELSNDQNHLYSIHWVLCLWHVVAIIWYYHLACGAFKKWINHNSLIALRKIRIWIKNKHANDFYMCGERTSISSWIEITQFVCETIKRVKFNKNSFLIYHFHAANNWWLSEMLQHCKLTSHLWPMELRPAVEKNFFYFKLFSERTVKARGVRLGLKILI